MKNRRRCSFRHWSILSAQVRTCKLCTLNLHKFWWRHNIVGKKQVQKVESGTQVFESGALGKTPDGKNLATYKELCSIANDLNQPDLIYKFMHLANHQAMWNSKKVTNKTSLQRIETLHTFMLEKNIHFSGSSVRFQHDCSSGRRTARSVFASDHS